MTLQSGVTSGTTTFVVDTVAGLPGAFPFTVVIDFGVSGEEIVTVTNVASLTLTVTRGQDGTTATSHSAGAKLRHMMTARDLSEPQQHIAASAAVHGLAGTVVGTTDAQTLTNKTISGASNTITNVSGANITGANNVAKGVLPTDTLYNANVATVTNKSIDGGTNTITGITQAALPATSVSTTGTQTLTNKTINGSNNTLSNIAFPAITGVNAGVVTSVTGSFVPKSALPSDAVYNVDTGWLTGVSAATMNVNWSDAGCKFRVHNGVASLVVRVTRLNGPLVANTTTGNITDTTVCTIAAAQSANYPLDDVTGSFDYGVVPGSVGGMARLNTAGTFVVAQATPTGDINIGDSVRAYFTWLV